MAMQSISKRQAATRQLHLAILLYFQDADIFGVHTLAGAAHGILEDLLARSNDPKPIKVRREKTHRSQHKYVTKMVREAIAFLKHADRSPERELRFNPGWTDFLIYDSIERHIRLTREITHPNAIFLLWITAKYPTVLLFDDVLKEGIAKLRELFPRLGTTGTQRDTFLKALG
jgi:hypothetical protein